MSEIMSETAEPLTIQVSGGSATAEELAADLTVLQAVSSVAPVAEAGDDRPLAGGWRSHSRRMQRVIAPGREAWKYSARP